MVYVYVNQKEGLLTSREIDFPVAAGPRGHEGVTAGRWKVQSGTP